MAVKIRLKRLGKMRAPYYRIVVADARTKRDGRAIEEIGKYHPTEEPSFIEIDRPRAQYWLSVGAQPTEQVMALLKITGDWQTHKGQPGGEGTLRVKEPRTPVAAPPTAGDATSAHPAAAAQPAPSQAPIAPEPAAAAAPPEAAAQPTTEPQPAEVANAEQPEGADEQAEAGSAGSND